MLFYLAVLFSLEAWCCAKHCFGVVWLEARTFPAVLNSPLQYWSDTWSGVRHLEWRL